MRLTFHTSSTHKSLLWISNDVRMQQGIGKLDGRGLTMKLNNLHSSHIYVNITTRMNGVRNFVALLFEYLKIILVAMRWQLWTAEESPDVTPTKWNKFWHNLLEDIIRSVSVTRCRYCSSSGRNCRFSVVKPCFRKHPFRVNVLKQVRTIPQLF